MEEMKMEKKRQRDEWEIKEDLNSIKRAMSVFKDPERLKDVQDLIKENSKTEASLNAIAEGNLQEALGLL